MSQRNAILNPAKKKIITGPFGCGKSVIVRQAIKIFAKKEEDIVYYIGWDEYTLFHVEMEMYCKQLGLTNVKCVNIADLFRKHNANEEIMSLVNCLELLRQENQGTRVHVVIDEFDGEKFKPGQSPEREQQPKNELLQVITSPFFKESFFLISLQSCLKERDLVSNNEEPKELSRDCFKDIPEEDMLRLNLPKTMRYTSKIRKVVKFILDEGKNETSYDLSDLQNKPTPESAQNESGISGDAANFLPIQAEEDSNTLTSSSPDEMNENKFGTSKTDLDAYFEDYGITTNTSNEKIHNHFSYPENLGDGTGVEGTKPVLLRLDTLSDETDCRKLAYLMQSMLFKEDKTPKSVFSNLMVVCNSRKIVPWIRWAFYMLKVKHDEYLDYIYRRPSRSIEEKRQLVEGWKTRVLLADCMGCRGLEAKEVVVVWKESDYHNRHLLAEALSRARSKLYMVTVKADEDDSQQKTDLSNVIDKLMSNKSIIEVAKGNGLEIAITRPITDFQGETKSKWNFNGTLLSAIQSQRLLQGSAQGQPRQLNDSTITRQLDDDIPDGDSVVDEEEDSSQYGNLLKNFESHYSCPICLDIADDAVECTNCFKIYCGECTEGINTCPSCRCTPSAWQPSRIARQIIDNLKTDCPNDGCKEKPTRSNLKVHLEKCEWSR
uniref:RING-type domain-containing protein n=1 Tax=Clytia hemisphaerica TaxID=252671 RepID=A0A7M5X796_9CNID